MPYRYLIDKVRDFQIEQKNELEFNYEKSNENSMTKKKGYRSNHKMKKNLFNYVN